MNIKRKVYSKYELIFKDFIARLLTNRNLADNTIKTYGGHIIDFINYFGSKVFNDLSNSEIQEYINLQRKTRSEGIARIALCSIRQFYDYLVTAGMATSNATQGIVVRVKRYQRMPLAQLEINKVQQLILCSKNDSESMLFAKVIYWTGMSASEFCCLIIEDFFFKDDLPVIMIRRRDNTVEIPIPTELATEIQNFMTHKNLKRLSSKYLFPTAKGKKFNHGNLYKLIRPILETVCSTGKGPKKLRDVFVTDILKNSNSESIVKKVIGLKRVGSLVGYTSQDLERLLQVHRQFHPKA